MRSVPLSILLALTCTAASLRAQDEIPPRRQPPGFQDQVNSVFGEIISGLSYYPFYNIAHWFGMSEDPQARLDDQGNAVLGNRELFALSGPVMKVAFSPASAHVWAVGGDNTVHVYDLTGKLIVTLAHEAAVQSVAVYPDEAKFGQKGEILTATADGVARVFDTEGNRTGVLTGHEGGLNQVVYSGDGFWVATAGADGTVRLWDSECAEAGRLAGHDDGAHQVFFAPGNAHVATIDGRGALRVWWLWDDADGSLSWTPVEGIQVPSTTKVEWSETGATLVAANNSSVTVFLLEEQRVVTQNTADLGGRRLLQLEILEEDAGSAARYYTDDGQQAFVSAGAWAGDIETQNVKASLNDLRAMAGDMRVVAADGTTAPSLGSLDGERTYRLIEHEGGVGHVAFAPDGHRLITTSGSGKVYLHDWLQRGPDDKVVVTTIPFVVLWLVFAAVFFTLFMRFVNFRMFKHAIQCVAGKFSDPKDVGEVSHFQALSAALSATVGLGNIAGVAIAVSIGGPGATFWMIVAGLLGMTLKFTECTLGQKFRKIDDQGRVSGGPMHYLADGLREKGLGIIGVPLALIFTVFCIGGSLAGGNAFQVNQSLGILQGQVPFFQEHSWVYGAGLAFLVGIVIIGGIRRIAQTAETIVPTMCTIYVLSALVIIVTNIGAVPAAFGRIFESALTGDAVYGGAIGALIQGFRRAAFSNEAGVGSAAIAHSAARTPYPVREGIVALLEPFIDTVVVCTMTALVIGITGVYENPAHFELVAGNNGAALTAEAFKSVPMFAGWFPWLLMAAVILFAFSTMISWSYYGERCWTNLFGPRSSLAYKLVFLAFVVLGSVVKATNVLEFGDLMILLMAFPNILGLYFLVRVVRRELIEYEGMMDRGEIKRFK